MHLKIEPGKDRELKVKKPKSSTRRLRRQGDWREAATKRAEFMRSLTSSAVPDLSGHYLGPVLS